MGRGITTRPVLLQRLHHDPVQVVPDVIDQLGRIHLRAVGNGGPTCRQSGFQSGRGPNWFFTRDHAANLIKTSIQHFSRIERRRSGQQFVEKHAQAVNVRPSVDVRAGQNGLFRAHVGGRPDQHFKTGKQRFFRQALIGRGLGNSKINDFGQRRSVRPCGNQNVGRLDVSMDDSLLVRMLHRFTNLNEKLEALAGGERLFFAVFGDLDSGHQFHDEIRPATFGRTSIEYVSDVRVIHQSQRLSLGFEARDHAFGVHARLDHLECDASADRLLLFRHENNPASSFSDLLQQFVPVDAVTRLFARSDFRSPFADPTSGRFFQELPRAIVGSEQRLDSSAQLLIVSASPLQKSVSFLIRKVNDFRENFEVPLAVAGHRSREERSLVFESSWPTLAASSAASSPNPTANISVRLQFR
ncbi:MAG TPA: hypothetical protein VNU68_11445 [Verrucomicrobiae bacterium]|nr:hypothetical protein [Verrucomicrobiae bacterium]